MQQNLPQSPPLPSSPPPPLQMDNIEEPSTTIWDWSEFLDFNIDDQLIFPSDTDQSPVIPSLEELELPPPPPVPPEAKSKSSPVVKPDTRVRKRDPRMSCENFLAGRIPCACPEMDAKLAAEEEAAGPGKKKAKTGPRSAASSGVLKCQVPGCEADISELKGYHKRHRVCLRCANATSVVLDGQCKRYCQQCGKFHILSDFDEGKRSCRRKLERHNNRRRRKPSDSKGSTEKESRLAGSAEDDGCDDETGKDTRFTSIPAAEGVTLLEAEGHNSVLPAHAQNIQSDSIVSFGASGETQSEEEKEKYTHSPSNCEDKSAFSSVCPTGRISFKLYDWNPAEFPRRLRHQIFQWLSSMPVELEGYIRPGCTILTLFIAMPKFMWAKLSEDPVVCIRDLLASPNNMLSGRDTFFIYLNNMMFSIMKDGTSVIKVKVQERTPKLHYVHPTCFEAGKPLELIACGSNLLQPKFRFLVSFAGKYLTNDVCITPCPKTEDVASALDHQLLKISVPHTELTIFGPGFIEVENEAGLSNFIPILVADKEICSEIKTMQTKFYSSSGSRESQPMVSNLSCEVAVLRHKEFSEFILDMAWLLKETSPENIECNVTSWQLQRLTYLLNFLVKNDSTIILGRVLGFIKIRTTKNLVAGVVEADRRLFERTMKHATDALRKQMQKKVNLGLHPKSVVMKGNDQSSRDGLLPSIPASNQDMGLTGSMLDSIAGLTSGDKTGTVPLLHGEHIMRVSHSQQRPNKSGNIMYTNNNKLLMSRPLIYIIASAAVCLGICLVLLHPRKATTIATTIRRCMFDRRNS